MLSNKLIESAKKNNDSIDDIILLYPEDCPNFDSFVMFANVVYAYVSIREHGGAKMHGFGLNNQVEVE